MEALKFKTVIKKDGVINITGAPIKKGQKIELIILVESPAKKTKIKNDFLAIKLKTGNYKFDRNTANER